MPHIEQTIAALAARSPTLAELAGISFNPSRANSDAGLLHHAAFSPSLVYRIFGELARGGSVSPRRLSLATPIGPARLEIASNLRQTTASEGQPVLVGSAVVGHRYRMEGNVAVLCRICLQDIEPEMDTVEMRCGHAFQYECGTRWAGREQASERGRVRCPRCHANVLPGGEVS